MRDDVPVSRLGMEISASLKKRAELVIVLSPDRITMRQLVEEGLEIRVKQLEGEIEKKAGAA